MEKKHRGRKRKAEEEGKEGKARKEDKGTKGGNKGRKWKKKMKEENEGKGWYRIPSDARGTLNMFAFVASLFICFSCVAFSFASMLSSISGILFCVLERDDTERGREKGREGEDTYRYFSAHAAFSSPSLPGREFPSFSLFVASLSPSCVVSGSRGSLLLLLFLLLPLPPPLRLRQCAGRSPAICY